MPNPRRRPRMPKLPLQRTPRTQTPRTPVHIKLRPPPRFPSPRTHLPDPIHTPNFTPRHPSLQEPHINSPLPNQSVIQSPQPPTPALRTSPRPTQHPHASPPEPCINSPLPNQSPVQSPQPPTPALPTPHRPAHHLLPFYETPSVDGHTAQNTPSDWSGGLFSGHAPLTLETLYPTPPTDRTDVIIGIRVETGRDNPTEGDARVRRLSFGVDMASGREPVAPSQPRGDGVRQDPGIPQPQHKRSLPESDNLETRATRRRRRSLPHERHVTQDKYECSQTDDIEPAQASPLCTGLLQASADVLIPETPLPGARMQKAALETPLPREGTPHRTPEAAVRRCRAPVWDGPITQIPETPVEQLPPREAPKYVVRTAVTASAEAPSLEVSAGEVEAEAEASGTREERRMGLLWLDIGGESIRENGDDTRLGEDSDSASTEPPSPARKEDEIIPRAQVFCRSVRVSIPAGGFRSPSPEASLTDV